MLKVGQPAPVFDLPDGDMNVVSLNGYRGLNNVVLYFYPKDDTPGCTLEAIDFSDLQEEFLGLVGEIDEFEVMPGECALVDLGAGEVWLGSGRGLSCVGEAVRHAGAGAF